MKYLLLLSLLILNSGISQSQIVMDSYVFENGIVKNRMYTCNKFAWEIKFPEETTITSMVRINELEKKGLEAIKNDVPDGIQT
jgi:hypothetical protein